MAAKLFDAVQMGQASEVKKLLAGGAKVDQPNKDGITPLMEAASMGKADLVDILLKAGADPKRANSLALDFAVRLGNAKCVKLLLEGGADPNRSDAQQKSKKEQDPPPLFEAAARGNLEMVQMLLDAGAKKEKVTRGLSAAAIAAAQKHTKIYDLLTKKGAAPKGALRMAIESGNAASARSLIAAGADLEDAGSDGMTPLALAAYYGRDAVLPLLIQKGAKLEVRDQYGNTPLAHAVSEGKLKSVQLLLDAGAKLTGTKVDTVLAMAISMNHTKIVELLLERGANPNEFAKGSVPPLFEAIQSEKQPLVQLLLDHKADPNIRIEGKVRPRNDVGVAPGATPLMAAASIRKPKIVQALLDAGASPLLKDSKGNTAADIAARAGDTAIVNMLKSAGSSLSIDPRQQQAIALVKAAANKDLKAAIAALAAGADPNSSNEGGKTALTSAAQHGMTKLVKALLEAGANPSKASKYGESPLRAAALRTNTEIVQLLLNAGANVNAKYEPCSIPAEKENTVYLSYETALHDAAVYSSAEVMKLLINAGANIDAVGKDGCTPIVAAVNNRRMDSAEFLLAAGANVREMDKIWLSSYYFKKSSESPAFQKLVKEVSAICGSPAEEIPNLPGAVAFKLKVDAKKPRKTQPADQVEAARQWGADFANDFAELDRKADAVLAKLAEKVRARNYLLVDAGKPIGCGPMVQYLALLPTADKYEAMAAFGVRGNDQELQTKDIIDWFRKLEKEEPFELRGVRFDVVDIEFHRIVKNPEKLAKRACDFCHDMAGGSKEGVKKVARQLRNSKRLFFWWD